MHGWRTKEVETQGNGEPRTQGHKPPATQDGAPSVAHTNRGKRHEPNQGHATTHNTRQYPRGRTPEWEANQTRSLIMISGDIHPNLGPPKKSTHHNLLQAIRKAGHIRNVKPRVGTPLEEYLDRQGNQKITEAMESSQLRWATYNIGGPAVAWKI